MKGIKCVVWDLDETLWNGILLESNNVRLKPGVEKIIKTLDSRGILHSIASKGSYEDAMTKLKEFHLDQYFLYPEISWNAKSVSIERIQKSLNIGMNTILFIDDQPFEREEVKHVHPEVVCVDAHEYKSLPQHPRLNPKFITEDSRRRRLMYLANIKRKEEEKEYKGPKREFLASLNMKFIISRAKEEELKRAEELTLRTNQLNTTGRAYDYYQLRNFLTSDRHQLLISELEDKYGAYGKIGLALIEKNRDFWYIKLFLMSCRAMSYGVGTIFLSHILQEAKGEGKKVQADFRDTGRNRMMYITFKFANFKELKADNSGSIILENDLSMIQKFPSYVKVIVQKY